MKYPHAVALCTQLLLIIASTSSWPLQGQDVEVKEIEEPLEGPGNLYVSNPLSFHQHDGKLKVKEKPTPDLVQGQDGVSRMKQYSVKLPKSHQTYATVTHRRLLYKLLKNGLQRQQDGGFTFSGADIECGVCKLLVMFLQTLVSEGKTQDEIAEIATKTCMELRIEDNRVCLLIIKEFKVSTSTNYYNFFFIFLISSSLSFTSFKQIEIVPEGYKILRK